MLILSRRPGETIAIGENITITVMQVNGNQVRIGIDAPKDVAVDREEIATRKRLGLKPRARAFLGCLALLLCLALPGLGLAQGAASGRQCTIATKLGIPCYQNLTTNPYYRGPLAVPGLAATTAPDFGTTPATIEAGFAHNVLGLFETNPNMQALLGAMDPLMLARFSTSMSASDPSGYYTYWMLAYAACCASPAVSAVNLRRLQAAFGPNVAFGVAYASPATLAAYAALPQSAPLAGSQYWLAQGHTQPALLSPYLYDLFLLQYFSGTDSPQVALRKAALYAQVKIQDAPIIVVIGVVASVIGIVAIADSPTWTKITDWLQEEANYYALPSVSDVQNVVVPPVPDLYFPPIPDPGLPNFPEIPDVPPNQIFCIPGDVGECSS